MMQLRPSDVRQAANDSSPPPAAARSAASRFHLAGSVLAAAAIFGYLAHRVSAHDVATLLQNVDQRGLAVVVILALAGGVFRAWGYALLLSATGHRVGKLPIFLITLVRNMFSDLLPARLGTVVYVYLTTRLGIPFGAAASSFTLACLFDFLALAPMILLAAAIVGSGSGFSRGAVAILGTLLAIATVTVLIGLPKLLRLAGNLLRRLNLLGAGRRVRWGAAFEAAAVDVERTRKQGVFLRVLVLAVLVRGCRYAAFYMFLGAFAAPLGYGLDRLGVAPVFIGLSLSELAASLPGSGLAGLGANQGAWGLVFRLLVFPAQLANPARLAYRLFNRLFVYSLGALSLLILLFPSFRRALPAPAVAPSSRPLARPTVFYGRLAAFLAALALTGMGLFRLMPPADPRPLPEGMTMTPLEMPAPVHPPPVHGWVAYEWEGGLYRTCTDTGVTRKLADQGRYPRWAPDGLHIAYWRGTTLIQAEADGGQPVALAEAREPHGIAYHPEGHDIYFVDGDEVKSVSLRDRSIRTHLEGHRFREIDLGPGDRFVASVFKRPMHYILACDLASGRTWPIGHHGCSASLSPDGVHATRNSGTHLVLFLDDWATGTQVRKIPMPPNHTGDNHFWSNHPDWIALVVKGYAADIYLLRVSDTRFWRVTRCGRCDRPDLFVPPPADQSRSARSSTGDPM